MPIIWDTHTHSRHTRLAELQSSWWEDYGKGLFMIAYALILAVCLTLILF